MARSLRIVWPLIAVSLVVHSGCHPRSEFTAHECADYYQGYATQIEYPDTEIPVSLDALQTPAPHTVRHPSDLVPRPLGLEEAVKIALDRSEVVRDIGARVVAAPATVSTVYDAAIRQSDPLFGPEAALSAFDAQLSATLLFRRDERTPNNFFFAGGVGGLVQNTADFTAAFTKQAATGTQFTVRNITNYNRSNIPSGPGNPNRFPSAYDTAFEALVRQPLLRGAGIEFNRIAGPNARPGTYNGVLIARLNTDVSLADFEASVRDLLMEVQTTYWQLYFAYREVDARMAARNAALQTWRAVQSRREAGLPGADSEREALAREQYFAAQAAVDDALSATNVSGLVVTTAGGLYTVERRLRYLLGLPTNDGQLLRPTDEPLAVDVTFDWNEALCDALTRRVELRRQKWVIKRRELELAASHNFTRMQIDMVGAYRWRGFGDALLGSRGVPNGSAFEDLFQGDLEGWDLGLELQTPIGNRIGHTAVRNAEWNVTRERAIYRQQEQGIARELSRAFTEVDRAYTVTGANYNRRRAAQQQLAAVEAKYDAGLSLLEFVIDAQRRVTEASSTYYRSLVNYSIAIANVHLARGMLLDSMNVYLAEGPWSSEAHASARKQARRFRRSHFNYCLTVPSSLSAGRYPQQTPMPVSPPGEPAVELLPPPAESLVEPLPTPSNSPAR
jgi:outer membrane protein TolC